MKIIQNVSINCQQIYDSVIFMFQQEYPNAQIQKGTKITKDDSTEIEIMACSIHHIQIAFRGNEGIRYKDIQMDTINPVTTQIEINEVFESDILLVQIMSIFYEVVYQYQYRKKIREIIKKVEEQYINC